MSSQWISTQYRRYEKTPVFLSRVAAFEASVQCLRLSRCFSFVLVVALLVLLQPPVFASTPASPSPLTAKTYSTTAIELFWPRATSTSAVVGYEVVRDGVVLGVFDALSYYDAGLDPESSYQYAVTTVDSDGARSATVSITVSTAANAVGGNVSSNEGPGTITGLRAIAYSSTAAEVFWDRSLNPGLLHEIAIDDEVVATIDGISYFTSSLLPGSVYSVSVTAIDRNGLRSPTAVIVIDTIGSTFPRPIGALDSPILPPAPVNPRLVIYSSTAAELFWDRPPESDQIVSVEVFRDGELIGSTSGISYFDDTRSPGDYPGYLLRSVRADGSRSETIAVPEASDELIITQSNAGELLKYLISVANQEPLNDIRSTVDMVYGESVYGTSHSSTDVAGLGLELISSEYDPATAVTQYLYQCEDGGTYLFMDQPSVYGGGGGTFNGCTLPMVANAQPINGVYSRSSTQIKYVYNPGWELSTSYEALSIFDAAGQVRELNAVLSDTSGLLSSGRWSGVAFTAQSPNGQTTINDAQFSLTDGQITGGPLERAWQRTFSADFTVSAPMTGNNPITVRTIQEFSTSYANTCCSSGVLGAHGSWC